MAYGLKFTGLTALLGLAVLVFAGSPSSAALLYGDFTVTVFQGSKPGNINDPEDQALLSNPWLNNPAFEKGTFSYSGNLDWDAGNVNSVTSLVSNGGVNTLPSGAGWDLVKDLNLSSGGFNLTTIFKIEGNAGPNILGGTILHDDGIGLYVGNTLLTALVASVPTSPTSHSYSNLTGLFTLIFVASNSLPQVLEFSVTSVQTPAPGQVPLPAALPLFAGALIGGGYLSWRKKRKAAKAA